MATRTIGTGGDDSSVATWEAFTDNDLVTATTTEIGAVLDEELSMSAVVISGATTNATYYRTLTADTGASFVDAGPTRALTYNGADGAALTSSDSFSNIITLSEDYARLTKLQVKATSSSGQPLLQAAANTIVEQNIFDCAGARTVGITTVDGQIFRNNLLIGRGASAVDILFVYGTQTVINNTIVCPTGVAGPTNGIGYSYASGSTIKNNAVYTNGTNVGSSSFTYTNCYSDDATPPTGVTTAAYDTGSGSGFESTTVDFRIKSTSAFNGNGTSTGAPATDIYGTTRASPPDVGCFEHVAAASGLIGKSLVRSFAITRAASY